MYVCCTTAAAACMVIRTVCDCFKHCPQWYSTNGWEERKKERNEWIHSSPSLFFFFALFRCSRWVVFGACSLHAQDGPLIGARFSFFSFFLKIKKGRVEQTVRCEGCIIVRIIRSMKEKGKKVMMETRERWRKLLLISFFFLRSFFLILFFFLASCAQRSLPCAKTQTTTAVSMLMCICSVSLDTHREREWNTLL